MVINVENFEPYVMENVKNDGSKILFTLGIQNIKNIVDVPVFRVEDVKLGQYLGMTPDRPVSLISMKDNLTDFDTYQFGGVEVDATGEEVYDITSFVGLVEKKEISPLTWRQSERTHPTLNMRLLNDIFREDQRVHVTLFFSSVNDKTVQLAKDVVNIATKLNVTYGCWDLMVSDPPVELRYKTFPSVGATGVYGEYIAQLRYPIYNETIHTFIEANVNEYKKIKQV